MQSIVVVLLYALHLYNIVLLAYIILSWLLGFDIVNRRNAFVQSLMTFLQALTEPVLGRIRKIVPSIGNVDISPIIAFLLIIFLQDVLGRYVLPNVP